MHQRRKCTSALFFSSVTTPPPVTHIFIFAILSVFMHLKPCNQFIILVWGELKEKVPYKRQTDEEDNERKARINVPFCDQALFTVRRTQAINVNEGKSLKKLVEHAAVFLIAPLISSRVCRLFMSTAPISKILLLFLVEYWKYYFEMIVQTNQIEI